MGNIAFRSGQKLSWDKSNGKFTDITQSKFGEMELGMIASALWTDVDNNGWMDLIVVGKWMPITIYLNQNGDFTKQIIENSSGWWNSINGGDFDNDGDIDYIVGNLGRNTAFNASKEFPMQLYLGDFVRFNAAGKEMQRLDQWFQEGLYYATLPQA